MCRAALDQLARHDPAAAADFRAMADHFGDGYWLNAPELPTAGTGELLSRDEVAARARVAPNAVTQWSTRGINVGGHRVTLTRYPGGYLETDVDEFLKLRDTSIAARTRPTTTSPTGRRGPTVRVDHLTPTP
jgi:hypothetical protein